jgi:malonyl-CoA decarboxylase
MPRQRTIADTDAKNAAPQADEPPRSVNTPFLSELLSSITERGRSLLSKTGLSSPVVTADGLLNACHALLSGRGEATGTAMAASILNDYGALSPAERLAFFAGLSRDFGPDRERIARAIETWKADPDPSASTIHYVSEPRRLELFRRLNRAPHGTRALVGMRADLLDLLPHQPALAPVDVDFKHLLASWFNRGFLVLRRIDWSAPAAILEKIIRYEAVHAIRDWDDLRRRIDNVDRRCYAFFHPALVDDPLIFVEVALTDGIPAAVGPLLSMDRSPTPVARARTAVFYSISNCQKGLAQVTFGNFLIKQVVEEIRRELPKIDTFVTLSPVPGFRAWINRTKDRIAEPDAKSLLDQLDTKNWPDDPQIAEKMRKLLEPVAAHYFLKARNRDNRPVDPVARFHLGNGARLEQIDWLGDRSDKGMRESAGLMVNYRYDLDDIERNHEAYANNGEVVASGSVRRLLKGDPVGT